MPGFPPNFEADVIAVPKVATNIVVVFVAFTLSLMFVVQRALKVPVVGLFGLLSFCTATYLWAAAIGMLMGIGAQHVAFRTFGDPDHHAAGWYFAGRASL